MAETKVIIRATLRSPRRGEIEIGSARRKAARRREQPWTWQEGPHKLAVAYQGPGGQRQAAGLEPWLETCGAHLRRFVWRKADPHIQLQVRMAGLLATSSETFLADLQAAVGGAKYVNKDHP